MRGITPAMAAHLAGAVTTLCTCILLTRRDGTMLGFTDLDADVLVGNWTYVSAVSYSRTALSADSSMTVDNGAVVGVFDNDTLTAADVRAGLYDFAKIQMFAVNWMDPSMGLITLRTGVLGEVSVSPSGIFNAEVRGLMQYLANQIGEVYTASCRCSLGDARCKVPLSSPDWTKTGTVASIALDRTTFIMAGIDEPRALDNATWWLEGTITFTSGLNAGRSVEVAGYNPPNQLVQVWIATPFSFAVGDAFRITPGCDKTRDTCRDKFANVLNMRATPDIPGMDAILRYPTT